MKSKTTVIFVSDAGLINLKENSTKEKDAHFKNKITITYEVEEPKKEFTPSEIKTAWRNSGSCDGLLDNLFGEGWEE